MRASPWKWLGAATAAVLIAGCAARPAQRVVELKAKRFEFSPPELRLRKGEPVLLRVTSSDVTHGLFQKELGIDADIAPGRTTEVTFTPGRAGRYTVICDHFCGTGHGNMRLQLLVE